MALSWFDTINSKTKSLHQGELFVNIELPDLLIEDTSTLKKFSETARYRGAEGSFIIISQTCDLDEDNNKLMGRIILLPVNTISQFLQKNPHYKNKVENILSEKKLEAFGLIAPDDFTNQSEMLIVSLLHPYLVDRDVLEAIIEKQLPLQRYRLRSPYVEDLSHRFGELFSRVAVRESNFPPDPYRSESIKIANK